MLHRHLQPNRLSLAVIDDIIERGGLIEWTALSEAALHDPKNRAAIRKLAEHTSQSSERPDRPAFWLSYCDNIDHGILPDGGEF